MDTLRSFTFQDLLNLIHEHATSGEAGTRTIKLLDKGAEQIAKKIGEEAVETAIAVASSKCDAKVIDEVADLFYQLALLLECRNIPFSEIEKELHRRTMLNPRDPKEPKKAIP
jgi:phosphoribosyl-ATP pyrophosphohydrolase